MTPDQTIDLLDKMPANVAGYAAVAVAVAAVVLWLIGQAIKLVLGVHQSADQGKDELNAHLLERLDQVESTLGNVTQEYHAASTELAVALKKVNELRTELEEAKADHDSCQERLAKYETRIEELETEIDKLRSERSEPLPV